MCILVSPSSRVAEFPVFTICPSYDRSYKPELLSQDGLTVKDMRNFNYPKAKDSAMYLKRVTHNVTDLIKSITFTLANYKDEEVIFDSDNDLLYNTERQFNRHFGLCFTMQVPHDIQNFKVYFIFKNNIGFLFSFYVSSNVHI